MLAGAHLTHGEQLAGIVLSNHALQCFLQDMVNRFDKARLRLYNLMGSVTVGEARPPARNAQSVLHT